MRVLVVSVHPDDEVLGCGGTLLRHRDRGDELHWLILTEMKNGDRWSAPRVARRNQEIREVNEVLGADIHRLEYPALGLDTVRRADLVQDVKDIVEKVRPDTLYVPNRSDAHSDHRVAFEALIPAMKRFRHNSVRRILMYETPSETDLVPPLRESAFQPNWFVDIGEYLEDKLDLMEAYDSEFGEHPFPRSRRGLRALATVRGAIAGVEAAEAFVLLREVVDK